MTESYQKALSQLLGHLCDLLRSQKHHRAEVLHALEKGSSLHTQASGWFQVMEKEELNLSLLEQLKKLSQPMRRAFSYQTAVTRLYDTLMSLIQERRGLWMKAEEIDLEQRTGQRIERIFSASAGITKHDWYTYITPMLSTCRMPKAEVMLRFCLGLRLDYWEAQGLMSQAGLNLNCNYDDPEQAERVLQALTECPWETHDLTNQQLVTWAFGKGEKPW